MIKMYRNFYFIQDKEIKISNMKQVLQVRRSTADTRGQSGAVVQRISVVGLRQLLLFAPLLSLSRNVWKDLLSSDDFSGISPSVRNLDIFRLELQREMFGLKFVQN